MNKTGITIMVGIMLGLSVLAHAGPHHYKWIEDKNVSSDQVLRKSQAQRVLPVNESDTLEAVKQVMTDDLFMALAQYHKSRHRQDAESTPDTVLPEEIVRQKEVDFVDEDYRFLLEVSMKRYGARTRVIAKAVPVYRVRDRDAEAAQGDESEGTSVEVKVKSEQGGAVAMGPIFVAPTYGMPGDYGISPLPDAAERGGLLVRSFMYFLEKRVTANDMSGQADEPGVVKRTADGQANQAPTGVTEVNVKVKSGK